MPDYGTTSGSGTGESDKSYTKGSGYTASSSKASQRRKKLAKQLEAQNAAYERQKAIDAAKAISSLGMTGAAQAAEKFPTDRGFGGATQVGYSSSQAIDRTPVNKSPFEKAKDDFLMDIGAKNKDADYYTRLGDRTKAASDRAKAATQITTTGSSTRLGNNTTTTGGDDTTTTGGDDTTTTTLPPEIVDPFRPQFPQYPGYGGGMTGGIGAFGYSPALMQFESQQGAGQVPYYMAAARNQFNPNMSPAFQYAAQNYDILGGSQRTAPRPMEMMSAAERAQIAGIGSNFNTPNYNSPYAQSPPQSEFDFFKNMVSGGMPTQVPTSSFGKGNRGRMPDDNARGLASLLASRAGGMSG